MYVCMLCMYECMYTYNTRKSKLFSQLVSAVAVLKGYVEICDQQVLC